jgi:hypothetical protein
MKFVEAKNELVFVFNRFPNENTGKRFFKRSSNGSQTNLRFDFKSFPNEDTVC